MELRSVPLLLPRNHIPVQHPLMTDTPSRPDLAHADQHGGYQFPRKFLVVVDKTPECKVALRFATRRAQHTGGRVSLICVAQLGDFQQWRGVEEIMREEAHEAAESAIHNAAKYVNDLSGLIPELVIEHGDTAECVMNLIQSDRNISILVLAAGISKEGPGPLVTLLAGPQAGAYPIPVTIVPGKLSDEEIDELA